MFPRARSFLCTILTTRNLTQTPVRPALLAVEMDGKRSYCNTSDVASIKVEHDPENQEFHVEFPDSRAFLLYEKDGDLFKIMHTEVPEELGGRGLGKILAKAALSHIEENKYRTKVYCHFVQHYIDKYEPSYLKYIEK